MFFFCFCFNFTNALEKSLLIKLANRIMNDANLGQGNESNILYLVLPVSVTKEIWHAMKNKMVVVVSQMLVWGILEMANVLFQGFLGYGHLRPLQTHS